MEGSVGEPSNMELSANVGNSLRPNSKLDTESYLQSLGFVILNGKARFNLNQEPMYPNITAATDLNVSDEEESFIILGKDSLDCIQASTLATYADIQQRSMSVDYHSMISSLNSNEIYQKVTELLQENSKLKETLKQNNVAMKHQINTLATWQEETMKIHHNHKKKFAETKELINYLKKENAELKTKISMQQNDSTNIMYNLVNPVASENQEKGTDSLNPTTEQKEKILSLTEELNNAKLQCEKLSADVAELHSVRNLMSAQLKQATFTIQEQRINMKKLELSAMQNQLSRSSVNISSIQDVAQSIENCASDKNLFAKDKEIDSLKQSFDFLEDKLKSVNESDESYEQTLLEVKKYRRLQDCKIKQYNEQLTKMIKNIEAQATHITPITESVNKIINIFALRFPANMEPVCVKLCACYRTFNKEGSDLRESIKHCIENQNQFKLNLRDCNLILCQIETALEESVKTSTPCHFCEYCHRHNCNKVQWNTIHKKLIADFETQKKCIDEIEASLKEILRTLEMNNACGMFQAEPNKSACTWLCAQDLEDLHDCYKTLVVAQEQLEDDNVRALNMHSNFRKTCTDYDPILCYMSRIFHKYTNENSTNNSRNFEILQETGDVQESENNDKQSLVEEKSLLPREWEKLEEEKKQLQEQKRNLDLEYKKLETEKELLQQERINLHEEKMSLDRQSQLYADHGKSLQVEKKMLEIKFDNLAIETIALRENLEKKECTIKSLQKQVKEHMENVALLEMQMRLYEEDFKQERKVKEKLWEEKSTLDEDLQKQVEFNEQLQAEVRRLKEQRKSEMPSGEWQEIQTADLEAPVASTFSCPKCDCKFKNMHGLNYHVQICLDTDT